MSTGENDIKTIIKVDPQSGKHLKAIAISKGEFKVTLWDKHFFLKKGAVYFYDEKTLGRLNSRTGKVKWVVPEAFAGPNPEVRYARRKIIVRIIRDYKKKEQEIYRYSADSGKRLNKLTLKCGPDSIALSPDGNRILCGSQGRYREQDLRDGKMLSQGAGEPVLWAPHARMFLLRKASGEYLLQVRQKARAELEINVGKVRPADISLTGRHIFYTVYNKYDSLMYVNLDAPTPRFLFRLSGVMVSVTKGSWITAKTFSTSPRLIVPYLVYKVNNIQATKMLSVPCRSEVWPERRLTKARRAVEQLQSKIHGAFQAKDFESLLELFSLCGGLCVPYGDNTRKSWEFMVEERKLFQFYIRSFAPGGKVFTYRDIRTNPPSDLNKKSLNEFYATIYPGDIIFRKVVSVEKHKMHVSLIYRKGNDSQGWFLADIYVADS